MRGTDEREPDPDTYYIVHATEFVKNRPTVAEEHWFVYFAGWEQPPWYWWFTDSRQFERFKESRIMGSSRVGLVYVYVNVPTFTTLDARAGIVDHFSNLHREDLKLPADPTEGAAPIERLKNLAECARAVMTIKHVPSDLEVSSLTTTASAETLRGK